MEEMCVSKQASIEFVFTSWTEKKGENFNVKNEKS